MPDETSLRESLDTPHRSTGGRDVQDVALAFSPQSLYAPNTPKSLESKTVVAIKPG